MFDKNKILNKEFLYKMAKVILILNYIFWTAVYNIFAYIQYNMYNFHTFNERIFLYTFLNVIIITVFLVIAKVLNILFKKVF